MQMSLCTITMAVLITCTMLKVNTPTGARQETSTVLEAIVSAASCDVMAAMIAETTQMKWAVWSLRASLEPALTLAQSTRRLSDVSALRDTSTTDSTTHASLLVSLQIRSSQILCRGVITINHLYLWEILGNIQLAYRRERVHMGSLRHKLDYITLD